MVKISSSSNDHCSSQNKSSLTFERVNLAILLDNGLKWIMYHNNFNNLSSSNNSHCDRPAYIPPEWCAVLDWISVKLLSIPIDINTCLSCINIAIELFPSPTIASVMQQRRPKYERLLPKHSSFLWIWRTSLSLTAQPFPRVIAGRMGKPLFNKMVDKAGDEYIL